MNKLETLFKKNEKKIFIELMKENESKIALNPSDLKFVLDEIYEETKKKYAKLNNAVKFNIWTKIDEIEKIIKRNNGFTYYEALCENIKSLPIAQKKNIIVTIATTQGYSKFFSFLDKELSKLQKHPIKEISYDVKWTGGNNKTQFVQLIYGLHHAKLINHGTGEITKIVAQLSKILKVELNDGWQKNHSDSIHSNNNKYIPEIFENISKAYEIYFAEMIEKKKKPK